MKCKKLFFKLLNSKFQEVNIHDQPAKVEMLLNQILHKNISYNSENGSLFSSDDDSLKTPLMSQDEDEGQMEFNDIQKYFSDDSEDLVLNRKITSIVKDGVSPNTPMFSPNTPMLPQILSQDLEERYFIERVKQHEVHQKVRW